MVFLWETPWGICEKSFPYCMACRNPPAFKEEAGLWYGLLFWARTGHLHKPSKLQYCKESSCIARASLKPPFSQTISWKEDGLWKDFHELNDPFTYNLCSCGMADIFWLLTFPASILACFCPFLRRQRCMNSLVLLCHAEYGNLTNKIFVDLLKTNNLLEVLELNYVNIKRNYGTLIMFSAFMRRVVLCPPDICTI